MENFLRNYGPLLLILTWFIYRWWKIRRVKNLLPELRKNGAVFIDVRSRGEFSAASAPGSLNIPLQELSSRIGEIPQGKEVVVCCATGTRSAMARGILRKNGFKVHNIGSWSNLLR